MTLKQRYKTGSYIITCLGQCINEKWTLVAGAKIWLHVSKFYLVSLNAFNSSSLPPEGPILHSRNSYCVLEWSVRIRIRNDITILPV